MGPWGIPGSPLIVQELGRLWKSNSAVFMQIIPEGRLSPSFLIADLCPQRVLQAFVKCLLGTRWWLLVVEWVFRFTSRPGCPRHWQMRPGLLEGGESSCTNSFSWLSGDPGAEGGRRLLGSKKCLLVSRLTQAWVCQSTVLSVLDISEFLVFARIFWNQYEE